MANIQGILTTLNTAGAFQDLSPVVMETAALYSVPLMAMLPRTVATNVKHEWVEDRRKPLSDALNGEINGSVTTVTVVDGTKFRIRDLIRVEDEVMLVTARSVNDLTVVRAFGQTAAATHATASAVEIIGNANLEGADAIESNATRKTVGFNMTQIFQTRVEVSGSKSAVHQPGGDEFTYQLLKQLREHIVEIERALINGSRNDGSSSSPRTMAGLREFITSHNVNASGTLTQDEFIGFLRGIFDDGGSPSLIVASPLAMQAINFWGKGSLVARADDDLFGLAYAEYLCEFGLLRLVMDRHVPSGTLFALDPELIALAPLDGRDSRFIELALTGDSESALILTEATLELRNEYCHGRLYGITGGA